MCGIAGLIGGKLILEDRQNIVKTMCNLLVHRGPDNTSYFSDNQCVMGHTRLSLVDLSARSNQPFSNSRYVLVYNGEIYNHLELKNKLIHAFNPPFCTTSDTEVLFYGLIHWGIQKTLNHLKGMFAFAFYDKEDGSVLMARDRVGMKPLFYGVSQQQLIFSSEVKAIAAIGGYGEFNSQYVSITPFGEFEFSRLITAFKNVKQLEPGTFARYHIAENRFTVETYFKPSDYVSEQRYQYFLSKKPSEVHEEFEEVFTKSLHSVMSADAKMGAFVSGGVDSSLCAAIAFQKSPITLLTSNVVGKYSEFSNSTDLAQELKAPLEHHDFTPEMFLRDWAKTTWYYESPIVTHSNAVPFQNVSQLARANSCKAVITGEGSDELFLGYPRLLTQRFDKRILFPITMVTSIYKTIPGLSRYLNLNNENFHQDFQGHLTNYEARDSEMLNSRCFDFVSDVSERKSHSFTLNMLSRSIHSLLWRNDRMGMMHGIESRFPFLYEDVMELAINLPIKYKIGRSLKFHNYKHPFLIDKYIVRKLTAKHLSSHLAYQKKQGFPMYGLMFLELNKEFFTDGFWASVLNFSPCQLHRMIEHNSPYFVAKLASVEIWGSLFFLNQTIAEVDERIQKFAKINH